MADHLGLGNNMVVYGSQLDCCNPNTDAYKGNILDYLSVVGMSAFPCASAGIQLDVHCTSLALL